MQLSDEINDIEFKVGVDTWIYSIYIIKDMIEPSYSLYLHNISDTIYFLVVFEEQILPLVSEDIYCDANLEPFSKKVNFHEIVNNSTSCNENLLDRDFNKVYF